MQKAVNIGCTGRVNGMGEPDTAGSYVRIVWHVDGLGAAQQFRISEGQAEVLIAELQGALAQSSKNPL